MLRIERLDKIDLKSGELARAPHYYKPVCNEVSLEIRTCSGLDYSVPFNATVRVAAWVLR